MKRIPTTDPEWSEEDLDAALHAARDAMLETYPEGEYLSGLIRGAEVMHQHLLEVKDDR